MKTCIPCLFIACLAVTFPSNAQSPAAERLKEKTLETLDAARDTAKHAARAVAQGAREAWAKTKPYLSEDPETYRGGAQQRINDLGAEIAALRRESRGFVERTYFFTRLDALEQQHKYATERLAELPQAELRQRETGRRQQLDLVLSRLEDHLDLAQKEIRDFTVTPAP